MCTTNIEILVAMKHFRSIRSPTSLINNTHLNLTSQFEVNIMNTSPSQVPQENMCCHLIFISTDKQKSIGCGNYWQQYQWLYSQRSACSTDIKLSNHWYIKPMLCTLLSGYNSLFRQHHDIMMLNKVKQTTQQVTDEESYCNMLQQWEVYVTSLIYKYFQCCDDSNLIKY